MEARIWALLHILICCEADLGSIGIVRCTTQLETRPFLVFDHSVSANKALRNLQRQRLTKCIVTRGDYNWKGIAAKWQGNQKFKGFQHYEPVPNMGYEVRSQTIGLVYATNTVAQRHCSAEGPEKSKGTTSCQMTSIIWCYNFEITLHMT